MAEIVAISHAAGLTVQASPWGLGRTFGGEAESRWVAFHPEECQVLDDGRRVAAACLNSAAYRDVLQGVGRLGARVRRRLGLLGRARVGRPGARRSRRPGALDVPLRSVCRALRRADPGELTPEVQAFREESVVGFLREMLAHVTERDGTNAICLLPLDGGHAGARRLERGRLAARLDHARHRSVLEALGRLGGVVRAPVRPAAARDRGPRTASRRSSGCRASASRARTSPISKLRSRQRARKASTTSGRGGTRPAAT